jgi:hypothetical protein
VIISIEQAWIARTGCTDRDIGFNIFDIAGSPGDTLAQIWQGFIDPEGNELTITNLEEFCRKHNLTGTAMRSLAKGNHKLKSHKGWTHKNSVRQRDYVKTYEGFIDPAGNPLGLITNLAEFCRQHGLDNTHMVAVANSRILSHRGWTHINSRKRQLKTYTSFIDPNGQRVAITNLAEFCRQHGLHPVHMHQVKNGQRKSHKGWTWREEEEHGE